MKFFPQIVLIITAPVLLLACGSGDSDGWSGATGDWAQERAAEQRETRVAVEALEVTRGTVIRSIEASGTVRGETEVTVISEAQGRIEDAPFELGRYVEAGDVLLRVDDTIARLSVEEARGVYENARLDVDATQRRFDSGSASQAELTRARSSANGARARLEAANKTLRDQTVRAPVSGYVAFRAQGIGPGNFLEGGTPVARIVNLDHLRVEVSVGEREIRYVDTGSSVDVIVSACGPDPYRATVHAISAGADERTGSYPVIVRWENSCERIRSGMSARVRIAPPEDAAGLIAPGAAIRRDDDGSYVFVVTGDPRRGNVEKRSVVPGERLGDRVLILQGIAEGDLVLTSGLSTLSPGQPVEATVLGQTGDSL